MLTEWGHLRELAVLHPPVSLSMSPNTRWILARLSPPWTACNMPTLCYLQAAVDLHEESELEPPT